jgi:hypothetical protein
VIPSMRKVLRGAATSAALRAHGVLRRCCAAPVVGTAVRARPGDWPQNGGVSGLDPAKGHVEAVKWAEKMADLAADVLATRVERAVLAAGAKLCSEEVA